MWCRRASLVLHLYAALTCCPLGGGGGGVQLQAQAGPGVRDTGPDWRGGWQRSMQGMPASMQQARGPSRCSPHPPASLACLLADPGGGVAAAARLPRRPLPAVPATPAAAARAAGGAQRRLQWHLAPGHGGELLVCLYDHLHWWMQQAGGRCTTSAGHKSFRHLVTQRQGNAANFLGVGGEQAERPSHGYPLTARCLTMRQPEMLSVDRRPALHTARPYPNLAPPMHSLWLTGTRRPSV